MSLLGAVRPAAVAGAFYPEDPATLRAEIATCLRPAAAAPGLTLKAVIVPHAGYVYSGGTAGHAYGLIAAERKRIRRVVLVGPCHRVAVRGLAAPTVAAFATPLGTVPLDRAALDDLADLPQVVAHDGAHAQEHSLEVQLPFLQSVLGEFSLVPLAVGEASGAEVAEVLERLWGGPETLVVISSDLSHFHAYRDAQRLDGDTLRHILAAEDLTSFDQACGALPINGLLAVARRKSLGIALLAHCNSGDMQSPARGTAGDRNRVVGYAAFALYESFDTADDDDASLGRALLARAHNAIAVRLGLATLAEPEHPALAEPAATFVTLTRNGALRGCIGSLKAHRSLDADVRGNAEGAAFRDPRFPPLAAAEFATTRIEVSLLTAPQALACRDEADALRQMRPGVDGLIFSANGRRSTFLPQVWDELPTATDFLAHLKLKAGLPADYWGPDVRLQRYEVKKWKQPLPPATR